MVQSIVPHRSGTVISVSRDIKRWLLFVAGGRMGSPWRFQNWRLRTLDDLSPFLPRPHGCFIAALSTPRSAHVSRWRFRVSQATPRGASSPGRRTDRRYPGRRGGPCSHARRTCSGGGGVASGMTITAHAGIGADRTLRRSVSNWLSKPAALWPAHSYSYGTCDAALAIAAMKRERRRVRARVRPGEAESTSARASSTRG